MSNKKTVPKKKYVKRNLRSQGNTNLPCKINFEFPHLQSELFKQTIIEVECTSGIPRHHIEKDYYVTLSLFCLEHLGFKIILKGGSSLSKGYNCINRSSEDIDLSIKYVKYDSIIDKHMKSFESLNQENCGLFNERKKYFLNIEKILKNNIPGCTVDIGKLNDPFFDEEFGAGIFLVRYDSHFPECFGKEEKNSLYSAVLLEISAANSIYPLKFNKYFNNITEERNIISYLELYSNTSQKQDYFWPKTNIICAHPIITILQKISDCLIYRFKRDLIVKENDSKDKTIKTPFDSRNVRHFEDCAETILACKNNSIYPPLSKLCDLTKLKSWPYLSTSEMIINPRFLFVFLFKGNLVRTKKYDSPLYEEIALQYRREIIEINKENNDNEDKENKEKEDNNENNHNEKEDNNENKEEEDINKEDNEEDKDIKGNEDNKDDNEDIDSKDNDIIKKWQLYEECFQERRCFHWGETIPLEECCNIITTWLKEHNI